MTKLKHMRFVDVFKPILKPPLLVFFWFSHHVKALCYKSFKVAFLQDGQLPTFFGYHDKIPFSADSSKILAMSVAASDKKPESECTPMKLGYFAKNRSGKFENKFVPFAETTTWAWQQGCMLQWNPSSPNREVIFNKLINGSYGSVIFDINQNKTVRKFQIPIYSVAPDGEKAVSLNFSRLGRLRPGYGYNLLKDDSFGQNAPENDGLFLIDLTTGKNELIVSLSFLAKNINNDGGEHYVNHATFSPDSKTLAFLHIWIVNGSMQRSRFVAYNTEKKICFFLETQNVVSHYCWIDNGRILATVQADGRHEWKYTIYETIDGTKNFCTKLALNSDGHPMASPQNSNIFVTDSRVSRFREDQALLFNINTDKIVHLPSFFMPYSYSGQVRCDLHPRWDWSGQYIAVDAVQKNQRALAIFDVQNAIKELV